MLWAADQASPQSELQALDKEIKEFKDARDEAKMQAYIAGNNADQYLGLNWVDYQEAIQQQEMYQEEVKELDEKLVELEKRRAELQAKLK
jgi:hypothetical protein